jgi:putative flippase GtrA
MALFHLFFSRIFAWRAKILRFAMIGGLTFFIYYIFLWVCVDVFLIHYWLGIAIAYSLAVLFHFFANRRVTFNASDGDFFKHTIRYIISCILNYIIQLVVIYLSHDYYGYNFYVGAILATCSTIVPGYLLMSFWVFKR